MSVKSDLDNLAEIIARLEVLAHQQEEALIEAGRVIKRLQEADGNRKSRIKSELTPAELVCGWNIRKGDRVRILNPRHRQPAEGEAVGITKDNLIKVRGLTIGTDIEEVVRRHTKNLRTLK